MTILFLSTLFSYLGGIFLPLCFPNREFIQNTMAHGLASVACLLGLVLGYEGLTDPEPWHIALSSNIPLLELSLRLDRLAAFFLVMISLVGLATSVYALGYVTEYYGKVSMGTLGSLYNGFLLSMTLVVLADNAFFFLILWELMSVTSYFLVVTEHEKNEVRYAGLFYLVMTHIGTAFIILTFLVLFQNAESFSFEAFRQSGHTVPERLGTVVFLAALIGFGTKAGIVPLHVWLPYAHPTAPSHVSALMSGVMVKTAIYGLIRVYFDFLDGEFPWWWGVVVLVVGTVSALLGVMYALMQHDLKKLLAYSSVENIGIILMGIGAGMIFSAYGFPELAALGIIAGLYHTLNHAVFKSLLFLGAGSLLYATHTRNMEEYGGLLKRMPWTGLFFLIGAVAISALPPTNGFVSEWLIFQNLFLAYQIPDILLDILLPIAAAMLALSGGLALACFAKAFGISFLALPRGSHAKHAQETPIPMRIGLGGLAVMCLVLGMGPIFVIPVLDQVSAEFLGVSVAERILTMDGWALTTANFASVSMPALAIMLLALSGVGLLFAHLLGGKLQSRSYKTWGCGLNVTSRMEYTATGFAQPIKRMFSTVYQPTIKLESEMLEESRYFAKRKHFDSYITPFFQQYLYEPVVNIFLRMSDRLRNMTVAHELNLYLGYVFAALLVVLLLVR